MVFHTNMCFGIIVVKNFVATFISSRSWDVYHKIRDKINNHMKKQCFPRQSWPQTRSHYYIRTKMRKYFASKQRLNLCSIYCFVFSTYWRFEQGKILLERVFLIKTFIIRKVCFYLEKNYVLFSLNLSLFLNCWDRTSGILQNDVIAN